MILKVRQNQEQQWADVTIVREEALNDEIRIHCGKFNIFVGRDFNPTLLSDILKVVQSLC